MQDQYAELAEAIIKRQELLIGPLAWDRAAEVEGLKVDHDTVVVVSSVPEHAIDDLVQQFSAIFGQAAVEVSKEAAAPLMSALPADHQPTLLR